VTAPASRAQPSKRRGNLAANATATAGDRLGAIASFAERGDVEKALQYLAIIDVDELDTSAELRERLRKVRHELQYRASDRDAAIAIREIANAFAAGDKLRGVVAGSIELSAPGEPIVSRPLHNARTLRELRENPELLIPPPQVVAKIGALEGRSLLFAAPDKAGKSTIQAQVCAAISKGHDIFGAPTMKGKIAWFGLEEHVGDVVRRFDALDADWDNVVIITQVEGRAGLEAVISDGSFVYATIDTLVEFASDVVTDPFSSSQWQPLIQGVTHLAHNTNTCIALFHHAAKATGKYRDSSAIGAGVDVICEMNELSDAESRRDPTLRVLNVKGRATPRMRTHVHLTSPGAITYELARSGDFSADLLVLQWVEKNPGCSSRDVEKGVGKRGEVVRELLGKLKDAGTIEDRGCGKKGALSRSSWYACVRSLSSENRDHE
jgi:hypothetical protein